MGASGRA